MGPSVVLTVVLPLLAGSVFGQKVSEPAERDAAQRGAPAKAGGSRTGAAMVVESASRSVDLATYVGWRVFNRHCATCHGVDGVGSSFAPAIETRVRHMSETEFERLLERGYRGLEGEMPAWGQHVEVRRYAEALWIYLEARGKHDLPPGPLAPGNGALGE